MKTRLIELGLFLSIITCLGLAFNAATAPIAKKPAILGACTLELEKDNINVNIYCTDDKAFEAFGKVYQEQKRK